MRLTASISHALRSGARRARLPHSPPRPSQPPIASSSRSPLRRAHADAASALGSESKMDEGEQGIFNKLSASFPGTRLEVQDVSGGCGSFYAILVSSPKFKGLSTIKQHKLVNECLKDDIKGIHGLQLKTIPEE